MTTTVKHSTVKMAFKLSEEVSDYAKEHPELQLDKEMVCLTCGNTGGEDAAEECWHSRLPCGHHCNHSWTHDVCCWCGCEFGEI